MSKQSQHVSEITHIIKFDIIKFINKIIKGNTIIKGNKCTNNFILRFHSKLQ